MGPNIGGSEALMTWPISTNQLRDPNMQRRHQRGHDCIIECLSVEVSKFKTTRSFLGSIKNAKYCRTLGSATALAVAGSLTEIGAEAMME